MIKSSMKNVFLCALVVIVTVSTDYGLKNLNSNSLTPQVLKDFDGFDLRMCRNHNEPVAKEHNSDASDRDDGQCGVILIPNLVLPKSVMEF